MRRNGRGKEGSLGKRKCCGACRLVRDDYVGSPVVK